MSDQMLKTIRSRARRDGMRGSMRKMPFTCDAEMNVYFAGFCEGADLRRSHASTLDLRDPDPAVM